MYLIDETYFESYEIPNIDEMDSKALTKLIHIVDDKSRLLLKNALGYELFAEFDALIDPNTGQPITLPLPPKWDALVNGVSYTNAQGVTVKWLGLKFENGSNKGSILAQFAYYFYARSFSSYLSGVGEVRAQAKNAVNIDNTSSLVDIWNAFVAMYQWNYNPDYCGCLSGFIWPWQEVVTIADYQISLLQFLAQNAEIYPNLRPVIYEVRNTWAV